MSFDFLYKFCPKIFPFSEEWSELLSKIYIGFHVKFLYIFLDFNENWILSTKFQLILKYQIS